jgi:hypothetical protein
MTGAAGGNSSQWLKGHGSAAAAAGPSAAGRS